MDAFYASVEIKDQPELQGQPVIVGGIGSRSVVAAASYQARSYGVCAAMSMAQAKRLCPQGIVLPPRMERYKEISADLHRIFKKYTDLIEPLALDEAWLDVTCNKEQIPSATWVATHIKWDIENQLGLTSSAGVSYNKFLAKIASAMDKPNGLFVITPEEAADFLSGIRLSILPGVGPVTAKKLQSQGLEFGYQLKGVPKAELAQLFGKFGVQLFDLIRGVDERAIDPKRERKSIGIERTFAVDADFGPTLDRALDRLLAGLWARLKKQEKRGRTVTLKVKFADFQVINKSLTFAQGTTLQQITEAARSKLCEVEKNNLGAKIRLLGVSVSKFEGAKRKKQPPGQLEIFTTDMDVSSYLGTF